MIASCNCFDKQSISKKCLVNFDIHREEIEDPVAESVEEQASEEEEDVDVPIDNDRPDSEAEETDDQDEINVHCFKIVGSHWEERYQEALYKCYELKTHNNEVKLRAISEPDNIRDCNAIKFEVLHNGEWHIMGYCGVKKIPKLKRAMHNQTIVSLQIYNMIRKWVPQTRQFRFASGINIVKKGRWDKDDLQNVYNSAIAL